MDVISYMVVQSLAVIRSYFGCNLGRYEQNNVLLDYMQLFDLELTYYLFHMVVIICLAVQLFVIVRSSCGFNFFMYVKKFK